MSGNNGTNDSENTDDPVRSGEPSPERPVPENDPSSAPTVQFAALRPEDPRSAESGTEQAANPTNAADPTNAVDPTNAADPNSGDPKTGDSKTGDPSHPTAVESADPSPVGPSPANTDAAAPEAADTEASESTAVTQPVVRIPRDAPGAEPSSDETPADTAGEDTAGGDTAGGDTAGGDTAGEDTAGGPDASADTTPADPTQADPTQADTASDDTVAVTVPGETPADETALSEAPTAVIPVVSAPAGGAPQDPTVRNRAVPGGSGHADTPQDRTAAIPPQGPPPPEPPVPAGPTPDGSSGGGSGRSKRTLGLVVGGVLTVLAALYVADLAVSSGKVPRGVTVAGVGIGGESLDGVAETLRAQLEPRLDTPVAVTAGDTDGELVPSEAGIGIDWTGTLGRIGSQPLNPFTRLASFFRDDEIGVVSTRDDAALTAGIESVTKAAAHEPREGNIVFEDGTPVPVPPQSGQRVDTATASDVFAERWAFGDVSLPVESVEVTVTREGLDRALAEVAVPAVSADLLVVGHDDVTATLRKEDVGAVLSFVPDGAGGLEPQYNRDAAIGLLAPQLADTEVEPEDAKIVLEGGAPTVVPGTKGELVDWGPTLENLPQLLAMENDRSVDAVYKSADPELTTEDAEKLGVREVIGEFTTGGFEYASGVNIRLAASEINGALVEPGETFSLNGYTGPRGAAEGYVESGIIEAGRPGKAIGGGISQLATTLYNAAYFAGMDDVDHTEHSYYISRYPAAREATVYEGAIDLQFRNPFDTGVLIQTIGTSSDITVRLWGTKTVDVQSITGERTDFTSPNTITLPAGDACIPSSGAQGFTVSDTRIVTDATTGAQISTKTRTVRYDPVPVVKCVSPQPEPGDKPDRDRGETSAPASPAPTEPAETAPAEEPGAAPEEPAGAESEPTSPTSTAESDDAATAGSGTATAGSGTATAGSDDAATAGSGTDTAPGAGDQ